MKHVNISFVSLPDPFRFCDRCGGKFFSGDLVRVRVGSGRKRYFHDRCYESLYDFLSEAKS